MACDKYYRKGEGLLLMGISVLLPVMVFKHDKCVKCIRVRNLKKFNM
jgi:hypothetical protein